MRFFVLLLGAYDHTAEGRRARRAEPEAGARGGAASPADGTGT